MTSSAWAQGGIAAAVGDDDSPALHAADTVAAGAGLVERALRRGSPPTRRTRSSASPRSAYASIATRKSTTRSGAKRRTRGAASCAPAAMRPERNSCARSLRPCAKRRRSSRSRARVRSTWRRATGGRVAGRRAAPSGASLRSRRRRRARDGRARRPVPLHDQSALPRAAAGIAIAARAGARASPISSSFNSIRPRSTSERSAAAGDRSAARRRRALVDERGARIMEGIDPALELAPRDVVARRVFARAQSRRRVYLDARALGAELPQRFPTVFAACMRFGIDPRVAADPGRCRRRTITWAASPSTRTGARAFRDCTRAVRSRPPACTARTGSRATRCSSRSSIPSGSPRMRARSQRARHSCPAAAARLRTAGGAPFGDGALRDEMYANVGVERDEAACARAFAFARTGLETESEDFATRRPSRGSLVAHSALRRRETRGSHTRLDFPATDGERAASLVRRRSPSQPASAAA
jgi:L-aspartate oxidase